MRILALISAAAVTTVLSACDPVTAVTAGSAAYTMGKTAYSALPQEVRDRITEEAYENGCYYSGMCDSKYDE